MNWDRNFNWNPRDHGDTEVPKGTIPHSYSTVRHTGTELMSTAPFSSNYC